MVIDAPAEIAPFTCTTPAAVIVAPLCQVHCACAVYFGRFPETSVQSVVVPEVTAVVFFTTSRIMATLPQYAYCAAVTVQSDAAVAMFAMVVEAPVAAWPVPPLFRASEPEVMASAA